MRLEKEVIDSWVIEGLKVSSEEVTSSELYRVMQTRLIQNY